MDCLNCLDACKFDALQYKFAWGKTAGAEGADAEAAGEDAGAKTAEAKTAARNSFFMVGTPETGLVIDSIPYTGNAGKTNMEP